MNKQSPIEDEEDSNSFESSNESNDGDDFPTQEKAPNQHEDTEHPPTINSPTPFGFSGFQQSKTWANLNLNERWVIHQYAVAQKKADLNGVPAEIILTDILRREYIATVMKPLFDFTLGAALAEAAPGVSNTHEMKRLRTASIQRKHIRPTDEAMTCANGLIVSTPFESNEDTISGSLSAETRPSPNHSNLDSDSLSTSSSSTSSTPKQSCSYADCQRKKTPSIICSVCKNNSLHHACQEDEE